MLAVPDDDAPIHHGKNCLIGSEQQRYNDQRIPTAKILKVFLRNFLNGFYNIAKSWRNVPSGEWNIPDNRQFKDPRVWRNAKRKPKQIKFYAFNAADHKTQESEK